MRKRTVTFLALVPALLAAAPVQAQLVHGYGFRAGGNISTLTSDLVDLNHRMGIQAATFVELFTTPVFSLQAELEFARRGYAWEQVETGGIGEFIGNVRAVTALNYLSLPVLVRLRYPGKSRVIPYALAGPRLDLLLWRKPGVFDFSSGDFEDDLSEYFTEFGVSGIIGFGIAVDDILHRELRLEARFNFGLTDLIPEAGTATYKNKGFDISICVVL